MTASSKVMTDPDGKRNVIQTNLVHCEICKSFVRREKYNRGGILNTGDRFTPRAKNIWRAIPGDTQLKILNTVWCTCPGSQISPPKLTPACWYSWANAAGAVVMLRELGKMIRSYHKRRFGVYKIALRIYTF
jgi:hypothetical protein